MMVRHKCSHLKSLGVLLGLLSASCGKVTPSDTQGQGSEARDSGGASKDEGASSEDPKEAVKSEDGKSVVAGDALKFEITANYTSKPTDVVVLLENSDRIMTENSPIAPRLLRANGASVLALMVFAGKLYNVDADIRFGALQTVFDTEDNARKYIGNLAADKEGKNQILSPTSAQFSDMVFARLNSLGVGNNWALYRPLTALRRMIDLSEKEGNGTSGFIRKDATLSVLAIGWMNEIGEPIESADMIQFLDAKKGAGNWVLSAITSPKEGCTTPTANGSTWMSNGDASAAGNTADAETLKNFERVNKLIKLQEYSGGVFGSICDQTLVPAIDRFFAQGMQSAYFAVKLPKPAIAASIKVTVNNSPVSGWSYATGTQELRLPTSIPRETKVVITFNEAVAITESFHDSGEEVEKIDPILAKDIPQSEKEFLSLGVRDIINAKCAGCHNPYRDYAGVFAARQRIAQRIMNGSMPQNEPTWKDTAEAKTVLDWIAKY